MSNILPGTRVKWTSQAQGSWVEKHGTVVAFLSAGKQASKYIPPSDKARLKAQDVSKVDRYLVEVPGARVTYYYCPRASQVEVDEG